MCASMIGLSSMATKTKERAWTRYSWWWVGSVWAQSRQPRPSHLLARLFASFSDSLGGCFSVKGPPAGQWEGAGKWRQVTRQSLPASLPRQYELGQVVNFVRREE